MRSASETPKSGHHQTRIRIDTEGSLSRAVVAAQGMAREAGFSEIDGCLLATAVSELARNILKYARYGEIFIKQVSGSHRDGMEVEARDSGPGIENIERVLEDHYSSGGSLGLGLPGVRRMTDEFEIESTPGEGTRVRIRKWL